LNVPQEVIRYRTCWGGHTPQLPTQLHHAALSVKVAFNPLSRFPFTHAVHAVIDVIAVINISQRR